MVESTWSSRAGTLDFWTEGGLGLGETMGGFRYLIIFTPKIGEDEPIWRSYFSKGLVQPPTS